MNIGTRDVDMSNIVTRTHTVYEDLVTQGLGSGYMHNDKPKEVQGRVKTKGF